MLFHIPNRMMCFNEKILYQYLFGFFCLGWDNFSSENILYVIT